MAPVEKSCYRRRRGDVHHVRICRAVIDGMHSRAGGEQCGRTFEAVPPQEDGDDRQERDWERRRFRAGVVFGFAGPGEQHGRWRMRSLLRERLREKDKIIADRKSICSKTACIVFDMSLRDSFSCPDSFCVRRPTRVGWIVAGPSLAGRLHGLGFLFVGELDQVPHYPETRTSPVGISTVPDPSASGRVDMLTSPVAAARAAVATEAWVISKHDMYLIGGTAPIRWRIEKKRIGFGWLS